jgi:DNA-binding IclR family transcriptional regulator
MAGISRIGCAIEDEEGEIGCPWLANPILDLTGGVIAAIAVAGRSAQIRLAIRNSSPGAPVFDHSGNANAAISVAGTTAQIRSEEFTHFGQRVRQTAADISEGAGFHPGQDRILWAVIWAGKRSRIVAVQPIRRIVEPGLEFD